MGGRMDERNPLKICFVMGKLFGGGAERAASELASLLAASGHEVSMIVRRHADWE